MGTESVPDVYAIFLALYGIPITFESDHTPRPKGDAWDIGAYEQ